MREQVNCPQCETYIPFHIDNPSQYESWDTVSQITCSNCEHEFEIYKLVEDNYYTREKGADC